MVLKVLNELGNKTVRLAGILHGIEPGRKGRCTPDLCATLDGRQGAACCKIGYAGPCVKSDHACGVYSVRPPNCRVFPRTRGDLKHVKNCGYCWDEPAQR